MHRLLGGFQIGVPPRCPVAEWSRGYNTPLVGLGTGPGFSGNCHQSPGDWPQEPWKCWHVYPQKQKQFVDLFEQLLPRSRFHFRLVIILALSSSDFVSIVVPRAASRLQMPMDGSGWWQVPRKVPRNTSRVLSLSQYISK
jgi:hypothetical protein